MRLAPQYLVNGARTFNLLNRWVAFCAASDGSSAVNPRMPGRLNVGEAADPKLSLRCEFTPPSRRNGCHDKRGTVLLEVLVALALFVSAAAIITAGLNASLNSVERLRLNTHAANLAVSVLSEVQIGIKKLDLEGPQQFEVPFEEWTWEILTTEADTDSTEASLIKKVEVTIRHNDPVLVFRLSQVIRIDDSKVPIMSASF
ncbi:MAG: hypothetical protein EXS30_04945 [Pedosphaera sp.]|nr:hypothetical protein [Pedosphaera sp.]